MTAVDLHTEPHEQLLRSEPARFLEEDGGMLPGELHLTDRRLIFIPSAEKTRSFWSRLRRQDPPGNIDLQRLSIATFGRLTHGLEQNVMGVTTRGGTQLRFVLQSPYRDWERLLWTARE